MGKRTKYRQVISVKSTNKFFILIILFFHYTAGKVRMLADPNAAFTKAVDLSVDLPPLGGLRSKRYSMIIDNGVVTELNVEPDNTGLSCSLADRLKLK